MATTIKLKTGVGVPSASSLIEGEIALDTSTQKLYTLDGSSVVEITGTDYEWKLSVVEEDLANAVSKAMGLPAQGKPYYFTYPINDVEELEMQRLSANKSIGAGGGTWWNRPTVIGREELGADAIYVTSVFGSPENIEGAATYNKQRGESVVCLTRILDEVGSTTFVKRGINDVSVSMREDEHNQPAIGFNRANGQILTTWGTRNGEDQDGVDDSVNRYFRYGSDINTLSASERVTYPDNNHYAQWAWFGRTAFMFGRSGSYDWYMTRGTAGQNYVDPAVQVYEGGTDQSYLAISYTEPEFSGYDAYPTDDNEWSYNPRMHIFQVRHPTRSSEDTISYAQGIFYGGGTILPSGYTTGGLYIKKPSDGSIISRWSDDTPTVISKADMETAYTATSGNIVRVLDVQYGQIPRVLFAEMTKTWAHGDDVPFGTTWDLKLVQFNDSTDSWDSAITVASGLRGMLGYDPSQVARLASGATHDPIQQGIEGYTSAYVLGASFYRGVDSYDCRPVVYYCDRDGVDATNHRLIEVTLNNDYSGVASTRTLIQNSTRILYRPEMALYGNKRFIMYQSASGWSTYNSWVAETRWHDVTSDFAAGAPIITQQMPNFSAAQDTTKRIGIDAISPNGGKMTWTWEYSDDSGSTWTTATQDDPYITVNAVITADGRQYKCTVANDEGSVVSNVATLTVV